MGTSSKALVQYSARMPNSGMRLLTRLKLWLIRFLHRPPNNPLTSRRQLQRSRKSQRRGLSHPHHVRRPHHAHIVPVLLYVEERQLKQRRRREFQSLVPLGPSHHSAATSGQRRKGVGYIYALSQLSQSL